MIDLKYSEILSLNTKLRDEVDKKVSYRILILANIIIFQLKEILECFLRHEGINASVEIAEYDNIVQGSTQVKGFDAVIIFWEPMNMVEGLHYNLDLYETDMFNELVESQKRNLSFVLSNLSEVPTIIFNRFSSMLLDHTHLELTRMAELCCELNLSLDEQKKNNTFTIQIEKILCKISVQDSIDYRNYLSSKVLYKVMFLKHYANYILPLMTSLHGRAKKAVIFDCDNTLWGGIIGEDGMEGIQLSLDTPQGRIYREIQTMAIQLSRKGILLGICSKNNLKDVLDVFERHPDMLLKKNDFIVRRVNWQDKASNLISIAEELNIGLDSLLFIDDSDFEIRRVNEALPMVETFQVPERLYEYPLRFRALQDKFFMQSQSKEDADRKEMYLSAQNRQEAQKKFKDIEEYLSSLELKVICFVNPDNMLSRLAQMTQKTNQFNLTTKRYSEIEITRFVGADDHVVYAAEVKDKYGSYGITILSIIRLNNGQAEFDTFLMSCRVIGRNVEYRFFDFIKNDLEKKGVKEFKAHYSETLKNEITKEFYESLGFDILKESPKEKLYSLKLGE